jgi:peptide/nickel transport system ATP-binding protein
MGVVGESGSGKSTLARTAVGLTSLTGGSIRLDGRRLKGRASRKPIQMVFQDPYASLDPRMTVGSSIEEGLRASGEPKFTVGELLELVGLDPERRHALPKSFSGGQRQRIALVRALAASPSVLIADEMTSALDVSVQGQVINLLQSLQKQIGFSMLFITHDLPVARYVSDDIAVMYRGDLVELGPRDQVISAPQHPYTASLLSASAILTGSAALAQSTPQFTSEG